MSFSHPAFWVRGDRVLSQNERMSMEPPKVTSEGKYVCDVDDAVFDSLEDYDRHCMLAHVQVGGGKGW